MRATVMDPTDALVELIGRSPGMERLRDAVRRLVRQRPWALPPVLVMGESGVGKNLVAQVLHRAGPRAAGPLVEINCAAIPETLLESELFGFEPGAFTDARRAKAGLIEAAHGGTLLLDEVALLPAGLQAKLLTFLDDRSVRRLGSTRSATVDVGLVAATNANLEALVRAGRFREDLHYRLAALTLEIPPLRDRGDDVVALAEHFLACAASETGGAAKRLAPDAREALIAHAWPGNVRELRNLVERLAALHEGPEVSAADLDLPGGRRAAPARGARGRRAAERRSARSDREQLVETLHATGWNISHAAARLGVSRNTLRHRIAKHGLSPGVAGPAPPAPGAGPSPGGEPGALPRPLTNFIGREREVAQLQHLVRGARLVTLTGAGGVGKSRLVLEVAGRVRPEVPHGLWYVDLTSLGEASLVASVVCSGMGLAVPIRRPAADAIVQAIGDRQPLIVLDNCEHLAEACRLLVTELLRRCPNLRVLVASRQTLGVPGETSFLVPSLSLPAPERPAHADELLEYEAIRLFVDRATQSRLGFALTPQNALAVAQVCHRLDGIPLAIELAAARLAVLSPEQINARLLDRFRLLTGNRPAAPPRQQTLRATMDWSHDLLSEPQRVLLRRLAVFAGSFPLEAAERVCGGEGLDDLEVLDVLEELVERSLVVFEDAEPPRYRLLETVRLYALERLQAAGEERLLRRRHRDWCLAFAQEIERGWLDGRRIHELVARTDLEYANLRAALAWREPGPEGELARLRLANGVRRYWAAQGQRVEGVQWLQRILDETADTPSLERAEALNVLGFISSLHGQVVVAQARLEQGLAMRRAIGHRRGVGGSLANLGALAVDRGQLARAIALLEESLGIAGEEVYGGALGRVELAHAVLLTGDRRRAADVAADALRIARTGPHPWCVARALNVQGDIAHAAGDWAGAGALYEEATASFRAMSDLVHVALVLNHLGELARLRGDLDEAARASGESLEVQRAYNDGRSIARTLVNLGLIALARDDRPRATALLLESLTICHENDNTVLLAATLEALALVAVAAGAGERAARLAGAAAGLRERIGAPRLPGTHLPQETLDAARAGLAGERFEALRAAGARLTLPEALREAARLAGG